MDDLGDDPHEWITQRHAAQILHDEIGLHPETARRVLSAGLLGRPRHTTCADYYLRQVVDDFVTAHRARGPLPRHDRNLVLVRKGNRRVRPGIPRRQLLDELGEGWRMSSKWRLLFDYLIERDRRPGFLVTVGGFVVLGADIAGVEWAGEPESDEEGLARQADRATRFQLEEPGDWYADWHARHLPTGRGGAPLRVWPVDRRIRLEGQSTRARERRRGTGAA